MLPFLEQEELKINSDIKIQYKDLYAKRRIYYFSGALY